MDVGPEIHIENISLLYFLSFNFVHDADEEQKLEITAFIYCGLFLN